MNTILGTVRNAAGQAGQALQTLRWVGVVTLIVAFLLLLDAAPDLAMWLAFALFVTTAMIRLPKIVGSL